MFNRFKYWLLCQLLGDICRRSGTGLECEGCLLKCKDKIDIGGETCEFDSCEQNHLYYQARKVWRIE